MISPDHEKNVGDEGEKKNKCKFYRIQNINMLRNFSLLLSQQQLNLYLNTEHLFSSL